MPKYNRPSWLTQHVLNPTVQGLTKLGISMAGSRILAVRGRRSGQWRTTPVNVLRLNGGRYLVAPRGETQWVRNLREAGRCELRVGRRAEPCGAIEISDAEKLPILREYLRRWKVEAGVFFGGVGARSPEADLMRIAPDHPVFRLQPVPPPDNGSAPVE